LTQAASTPRKGAERRIEAFNYAAGPDAPVLQEWGAWAETDEDEADDQEGFSDQGGGRAAKARHNAEFEQRLTEESRRAFEAGRQQGRQEGRQAEHEALSASQAAVLHERARQATEMIAGFAQERDRYLLKVEQEVVKLSLAVSARILRREAQMDPLLLTGAVRVALGQLAGSTKVRLLVPATELDLWSEAMALMPNLQVKPTVLAGEGMRLGDCRIEAEMGSVDLGIRSQLGEIERGFFDRAGLPKADHAKSNPSSNAPSEQAVAMHEVRG
jgi:flagellar assembly protein FliH